MKARIQRTDASILLAHAYPDQVKQIAARLGRMTRVRAQLLARSDAAARMDRIEMLKSQVDAGTYIVDSRAIAYNIQNLRIMLPITECEKHDVSPLTQEYEPQE
jgi:Anti-sigma-28 factor, FlgM